MTETAGFSYPERRRQVGRNLRQLTRLQPQVMEGFSALHSAGAAAGALEAKTKELIALAIAVATRCDDCIAFHTHDALKQGASRDEIAEALGVAVYMGGGPSVMYASHAMEALEQFQAAAD